MQSQYYFDATKQKEAQPQIDTDFTERQKESVTSLGALGLKGKDSRLRRRRLDCRAKVWRNLLLVSYLTAKDISSLRPIAGATAWQATPLDMTRCDDDARGEFTRREAARLIGAGAAGLLLQIPASRAQAAGQSSSMLARAIPSSGEKLPIIGLGSWNTFDVDPGSPQLKQLEEVLSRFVKLGGKVIDSSPMYGHAEGVIGELTAKLRLRDSLFIATKVWTLGKEAGIAMMERSMERFRTKRIDLMQVHNLADVDNQMSSLREWKTKGRIRYTGITHSQTRGFYDVERIMRSQKPDFVQINYSIMEPGAAQRILPLAQELRMGVIINRPFGAGGLFQRVAGKPLPDWAAEFDCRSWAQFFLKWIIAHPAVTCVIPATDKPRHLEDNMQGGLGRLPDAKMRQRMVEMVSSM